ncbi:MAG: hypothetical protein U1C12_01690 [Patescibacteria group bacterium]|nr:hypothetical protein [Patescibacteria group bacterium]
MNPNKLQKLKTLLEVANQDTFSEKQFLDAFKKVVEIFNAMKIANKKEMESIRAVLSSTLSDMQEEIKETRDSENKKTMNECHSEMRKMIEKSKGETQKLIQTVQSMIPEVPDLSVLEIDIEELKRKDIPTKNGIIEAVEKDIPQLGLPIRDALELLQKGEKLKIEAIENLREELDELKKKNLGVNTVFVGGGSSGGGRIVKSYDISSQLNGVLKTFSLPSFYRVISVHSSSTPFVFRETTDFTTDASAMTITFTDEITASSTLSAGQTITIVYSEA